jgi:hypothetical protein
VLTTHCFEKCTDVRAQSNQIIALYIGSLRQSHAEPPVRCKSLLVARHPKYGREPSFRYMSAGSVHRKATNRLNAVINDRASRNKYMQIIAQEGNFKAYAHVQDYICMYLT